MSTVPYQAGFTISSDLDTLYYSDGKGQIVELVDTNTPLDNFVGNLAASRVTCTPAVAGAADAQAALEALEARDAGDVPYTPAGTGAVTTTVEVKLRESMSLADKGGDATGVASAVTPLTNLFAATLGLLVIGAGTFDIPSNVTPAARDVHLVVDPTAVFTGAGDLRLNNQIPFQATPVASLDLVRKTFDSSWDTTGNIFMRAAYAVSELSTRAVVAVFGAGEATAAAGRIWGGNFVAYARHATATAIGVEINCGADVGGGTSYGLVIASANTQAANAAIQIQSNQAASQFVNGINFEWRATEGCITGNIINLSGEGAATAARFIGVGDITFTAAEIDLPSILVEATQAASGGNRVSVRGAASLATPRLGVAGSDTNINLDIRSKGTGIVLFTTNGTEAFRVRATGLPDGLQVGAGTGSADLQVRGSSTNANVTITGKGTGGVWLQDGAGNAKIKTDTTGIGFYGTTPVARPASYGTPTNVSKITSLAGTAASLADVGGTLAALITDLKSQGLIAA